MKKTAILKTGTAGILLTLCCSSAALAGAAGTVGLSGWLAGFGNVLLPAMIIIIPLFGYSFYRQKIRIRSNS